ncbi:MAG: glycosyltransferase family 2 protein, partial [Chloroflexi bacterium]|nr:glycosyltransferase family 2 protein [Chloroflexota bacterium]
MSLVSIVVPVYHNAASLADLLHELQAVAARNPEDSFEFICVDDGSRDDSFAVMQALGRDEPRLRIVRLSRNFGSVAAVMAGLSLARGDCVADISADLQDPPALLHDMLAQWRAGSKLVLAARRGRDDPFPTSLLSDAFYALFRRFAIA